MSNRLVAETPYVAYWLETDSSEGREEGLLYPQERTFDLSPELPRLTHMRHCERSVFEPQSETQTGIEKPSAAYSNESNKRGLNPPLPRENNLQLLGNFVRHTFCRTF